MTDQNGLMIKLGCILTFITAKTTITRYKDQLVGLFKLRLKATCNYTLQSLSSIFFIFQYTFEPRCEKTGLRGFRPGPTQTELCSHRRWLDA